jgi:hypothetical protein
MLAQAEEAADADHSDLDVTALVHQQIVDRADVLIGVVIDLDAVHLGRTPLSRRGRGGRRRRGSRRLVGGGGRILRERNGCEQCGTGKTGRDRFHQHIVLSFSRKLVRRKQLGSVPVPRVLQFRRVLREHLGCVQLFLSHSGTFRSARFRG